MMPRKRGLIIGDYDTAVDGRFTMTKFSVETPDFVQEMQEIPGMDGALDFTESAAGRSVYKTRKLTATFELSAENHAWREQMIDRMIAQIHGKRLEIRTPDEENEHLIGRVAVKKNFNNLAYAEVALTAVCDPFWIEDEEQTEEVPILQRSDNAIVYSNASYLSAYSTATGVVGSDTDMTTVNLVAEAAAVGTVACFRVELQANKEYYVSGRLYGSRGTMSVSRTLSDVPDTFEPIISTGSTGYLYIWLTRLQATANLILTDLLITQTSNIRTINFGQQPVLPRYTRPGSSANIDRALVCINGRTYVHHRVDQVLRTELLTGLTPIIAFRTNSGNAASEIVRYRRQRL